MRAGLPDHRIAEKCASLIRRNLFDWIGLACEQAGKRIIHNRSRGSHALQVAMVVVVAGDDTARIEADGQLGVLLRVTEQVQTGQEAKRRVLDALVMPRCVALVVTRLVARLAEFGEHVLFRRAALLDGRNGCVVIDGGRSPNGAAVEQSRCEEHRRRGGQDSFHLLLRAVVGLPTLLAPDYPVDLIHRAFRPWTS